jgi:hypothetical protein
MVTRAIVSDCTMLSNVYVVEILDVHPLLTQKNSITLCNLNRSIWDQFFVLLDELIELRLGPLCIERDVMV